METVTGQKSEIGDYFWPYGVTRSAVKASFTRAALIIGSFCLVGGGFLFWSMLCKKAEVIRAFAAAPLKVTRVVPENLGFTSLEAPPAYVNVTSVNEHSSQFKPSNCCSPPLKAVPVNTAFCNGGTVGSAPGKTACFGNCASVDVWLPESMRNSSTLQTPALNDPNAAVTLDITPPQSGKAATCSVWHYHYGTPPQKGNAERL